MKETLYRSRALFIGSMIGMALCVPALAQDMKAPTGPIEFTVGSGAGGSPDVIMRTLGKILNEEKIVENPVVVQNRTGGGHSNAYNYVLGKPADENTILMLASPVFTTPIVQGTPSVIDQVTPLISIAQSDLVLLVPKDSPHKTLADFVAAAKENPGRVRIAGGASGGNDHLVTALLEQKAGIKLTYIPHESGGAARATFLGGNVEGHFGTSSEALSVISSGDARGLAILSEERRPEDVIKDVPTAKEQGVDVVYGQFWGIGGPAKMDPALAAWWADKFKKAVESQTWQDYLKTSMLSTNPRVLDDAGTYFKEEQARFRELLSAVGMAK